MFLNCRCLCPQKTSEISAPQLRRSLAHAWGVCVGVGVCAQSSCPPPPPALLPRLALLGDVKMLWVRSLET